MGLGEARVAQVASAADRRRQLFKRLQIVTSWLQNLSCAVHAAHTDSRICLISGCSSPPAHARAHTHTHTHTHTHSCGSRRTTVSGVITAASTSSRRTTLPGADSLLCLKDTISSVDLSGNERLCTPWRLPRISCAEISVPWGPSRAL